MEFIAQTTPSLPDLSGVVVYGPLGILFAGVTLLAWRYLPRLFDAMLENLESSKIQAIRAADSTKRIEETMKVQTEHLATISQNTTATAECIEELGKVSKQQADGMQMLIKSFDTIACVKQRGLN